MKLPPGATGFGPAHSINLDAELRTFIAACHHAARRTHGTVTGTRPAGVTPNFHVVVITYPDHQVAVLRHSRLPLVAFASPQPLEGADPTFHDEPHLAGAFAEVSDLQILTVHQLQTPLSRADLTALSSDEHKQIHYWNPATIGDLLFNHWD